ncbi:MAG: HAD family hydrolase [Anaerolineales bacterium]
MPIQAIIFDLGGVLLRTEDYAPRLELAASFHMDEKELEKLVFFSPSAMRATVGEISAQEHYREIARVLGCPLEKINLFQEQFFLGDRLDTTLINFLINLRKDYKIGLLSNAWDDLRFLLKTHFNILDIFDKAIISAEVGLMKPDPRIYQLAVEQLGVSLINTIFVDDMPENVAAAQSLGMNAIRFQSSAQVMRDVNQILGEKKNGSHSINH